MHVFGVKVKLVYIEYHFKDGFFSNHDYEKACGEPLFRLIFLITLIGFRKISSKILLIISFLE